MSVRRQSFRETQDLRGPQRRIASPFLGGEFIAVEGPHAGLRVRITDGPNIIGRAEESTIALTLDKGVSRRHAVVEWAEGRLHIRDWSSTNGTRVNGKLVQGRVALSHLDIVAMGRTALQLICDNPAELQVYELEDEEETSPEDDG